VIELAKKLARTLFGEYAAYAIYSRSTNDTPQSHSGVAAAFTVAQVGTREISDSKEQLVREQAWYAGPDSIAYACFDGDRIVGVCFYWFGKRYQQRNFWPLVEGEAKLVQIVSIPAMRGHGVATTLIASSYRDMTQRGFGRAYARIWHSNTPSLRAFEKAGWTRVGFVLELNPLRRPRPIRIRFDARSSRSHRAQSGALPLA